MKTIQLTEWRVEFKVKEQIHFLWTDQVHVQHTVDLDSNVVVFLETCLNPIATYRRCESHFQNFHINHRMNFFWWPFSAAPFSVQHHVVVSTSCNCVISYTGVASRTLRSRFIDKPGRVVAQNAQLRHLGKPIFISCCCVCRRFALLRWPTNGPPKPQFRFSADRDQQP